MKDQSGSTGAARLSSLILTTVGVYFGSNQVPSSYLVMVPVLF